MLYAQCGTGLVVLRLTVLWIIDLMYNDFLIRITTLTSTERNNEMPKC